MVGSSRIDGVCVCVPFLEDTPSSFFVCKTENRLDGEESRFALRHLLGRCKIYEPFYQKSFMTERFQANPQEKLLHLR